MIIVHLKLILLLLEFACWHTTLHHFKMQYAVEYVNFAPGCCCKPPFCGILGNVLFDIYMYDDYNIIYDINIVLLHLYIFKLSL